MQKNHYLPRALPEPLQGLATLALDLRWTWHHGADELWHAVDPALWEATANPWLILETVSDERLADLAGDERFLYRLQEQLSARDAHFGAETWFASRHAADFAGHIAYFSMEFGLSEALPIYSGGLGILAGDLLKTACDLDVPIVGIGLLYQQGYFRQAFDANGDQIEFYPYNDPTMLPVVPLRGDEGEWVRVSVELPGRDLHLRAWRAEVGRRSLLLLDSNDLLNEPGDRGITSELYGGGIEIRLQQEVVLGIGGWRLLEKVGLNCRVCHLNEGQAAFAVLERARQHMRRTGQPFSTALRATRAGNLFTTHTPVAAGFDQFPAELMRLHFRDYADMLDIDIEELIALGRTNPTDSTEPFNMATLAMHGAGAVNGVSRLHRKVSRRIFQPLFPNWPRREVPIGHVTNGVHVPTWDSRSADKLWTEACGKPRWLGELESVETSLRQVDDVALWSMRAQGRRRLIAFLTERLAHQRRRRGAVARGIALDGELLSPASLTIGFARRFAEYKRTNLLLHDTQRLLRLCNDRDRPVQIIVAGKAHPHDPGGKRMVREWQTFLTHAELRGRVVFVEDYDLTVARELTQGVDVWINTPRRPWEACGTSGMKVLVNGGLNLSELDGWWAEAHSPEVGWSIGDGREHEDVAASDAAEADELYRKLEEDVIPCFYRRDEQGLPREWIAKIRASMSRLTTRFSSNRMLREYVNKYYAPLAESYARRDGETAAALEQWHSDLARSWPNIRFGSVVSEPTKCGHRFEAQVYLHRLSADAVRVELYADPAGTTRPERHMFERGPMLTDAGNAYLYTSTIETTRPASHYTPRVIPAHPAALVPLEANFILWHR